MNTLPNILIPNLIIGGAPKCGTSSLFSWLNDHPQVCGSLPKETFFLMDKHHPMINPNYNIHQNGLESYNHFFSDKSTNSTVFCEATTHYLYQQTALELLSKLEPKPNIVFLLRNPADRIYSSFEFTKHNRGRLKKELSFLEFAKILLEEKSDDLDAYVDKGRSLYVLKRDLKYSTYILYLEKWKDMIGLSHLHIFLFEDMIKFPQKITQKITDIMEIDGTFYNRYEFPKKNETYYIQKHGLHRVIRKYLPVFPEGSTKRRLKDIYLKMATGSREKDNGDREGLTLLNEYFLPYNEKLSTTFNLDITPWNELIR